MNAVTSFLTKVLDYVRIAVMDIGFVDVLDILAVAVLLYAVFMVVFRSGASRIVRVVVAILILTGLSSAIGMDALHFILRNTIELGVLALIIVFQPELRRMLETLGSRSILKMFESKTSGDEVRQMLQTVVDACAEMAESRTGALIVFEMESKLDTYFATGTRLDAIVSEQMLKNLFFPKAALHDGAVIIRSDRIVAAGCVLPLSENPNLSRDLGTRHRAGVGITEKSDAVVLIVSEETGMVSLAENGFLRRYRLDRPAGRQDDFTPRDEILKRLYMIFGLDEEERDWSLSALGNRLNNTFKNRKEEEADEAASDHKE